MSTLSTLKRMFLLPFWTGVPTEMVGEVDHWAVPVGALTPESFVVAAGVGHSITFEQDIARRFGSQIILLDPSPTGIATIAKLDLPATIEFHAVGLAGHAGEIHFGPPAEAAEGSFRKGRAEDGLAFRCTTLADLMQAHRRTRIDLLKIDIEGFEYDVLRSVLDGKLQVDVICAEIHHNRVIAIEQTILDAAWLILRLRWRGYRVAYNKNMDFTFTKVRRPAAARTDRAGGDASQPAAAPEARGEPAMGVTAPRGAAGADAP